MYWQAELIKTVLSETVVASVTIGSLLCNPCVSAFVGFVLFHRYSVERVDFQLENYYTVN